MELREDDQDPNLTQANAAAADFPPKVRNSNKTETTSSGLHSASNSNKNKLTESLGNIASLQAGLNIKRHMAESDLTEPLPAPPPTGTLANLLRPQRPQHDKIRPKSFQESVNDLSQLSQDFLQGDDQPIFSTPVRASFRGGKLRPRPHTVIHLEDARTPSKREAKTRLRELKTKGRRFSGDVIEQDIRGIEPSLAAVWSQFVNYEPSIPALSSVVTPSIK